MRLTLLATLFATSAAAAQSPPPRFEVRNTLAASVNVLGLQDATDAAWTWKLYESTHPLLDGAHVTLGLSNYLSPSFDRVGAWVELSPLSILDVRIGLEPVVYFGAFGTLISFTGFDDPFDEGSRDARAGEAEVGVGARGYVAPTLKLKVGPVILAGSAEFEWWRVDAPGRFFYDSTRDTLLRAHGGSAVLFDSVLLWDHEYGTGSRLRAGAIYNLQEVWDAPQNRVQRLGGIVAWTIAGHLIGLDEPTVILIAQAYLSDPYKQYEATGALAVRFWIRP